MSFHALKIYCRFNCLRSKEEGCTVAHESIRYLMKIFFYQDLCYTTVCNFPFRQESIFPRVSSVISSVEKSIVAKFCIKKKKRKEEEEKGKDSLHRILTLLIFIYTVIEYESLYTRAKGERKDKEEDMNILREG